MSDKAASSRGSAASSAGHWPTVIFVLIWSLIGAYIAVYFNLRIALPFFAVTGALLLILPFKTVFLAVVGFGIAHNPTYLNVFVISIGGFNAWFIELFMIFMVAVIVIELVTKRLKIETSPMFYVIGLFLISTLIQTARGFAYGYDISAVRTSLRNAIYPILIVPCALYFGSGGKTRKFIGALLLGWIGALIVFFLMYFGIFSKGGVSGFGRLMWPPTQNIMLFLPMLLVLLSDADTKFRENMVYWAIMLVSVAVLIAMQTRYVYAIVSIQIAMMIVIIGLTRPRGQRLIFVLKITVSLLAAMLVGVIILRIIRGEGFNLFIHNVVTRALSLFEWRKDVSIASRRHQILESIKLVQDNWIIGQGVGVKWHSLFSWGESRIDSAIFMVLGHQGLVGIVLFFAIFALWFQRGVYLLLNHSSIENPLVRAFSIAQPVYVFAVVANTVGSAAAYVLPANSILIICSAMISEKIYREHRKTKFIPKEF